MTYTFFSHVAFGDTWSATQHNNLLDNGDLNLGYSARVLLEIASSIPPMSGITAAPIQLVESSGAGTAKPVIFEAVYDTGTTEGRAWIFKAKYVAAAPKLKVGYRMSTSSAAKSLKWDVYVAAVSSADASMSAKVFTTVDSQTDTPSGTSDTQGTSTVTLTNADSVAEDDWVCVMLVRDTTVANNHGGSAKVTLVEWIYG